MKSKLLTILISLLCGVGLFILVMFALPIYLKSIWLFIIGLFFAVRMILKDDKNRRFNKKRINEGLLPSYITNKGESLWVDNEHHDKYSKEHKCFILVDKTGFFWGYSNNLKIKALNNEK